MTQGQWVSVDPYTEQYQVDGEPVAEVKKRRVEGYVGSKYRFFITYFFGAGNVPGQRRSFKTWYGAKMRVVRRWADHRQAKGGETQ